MTCKEDHLKTKDPLATFSDVNLGKIVELKDHALVKKGLPKEEFFLVVDRMQFSEEDRGRLTDSLSQAYHASTKYNGDLIQAEAHVITTSGRLLVLSEAFSLVMPSATIPSISMFLL